MSGILSSTRDISKHIATRILAAFLGIALICFLGGWWSLHYRESLNVRGELVVSEFTFRVRASGGNEPVPLAALTQIQLTEARLVDVAEVRITNPSRPDTVFSGLPRRTSFRFSPAPADPLLGWIDAFALPDSGWVRVVAGLDDPLGFSLTISSPKGPGQVVVNTHGDATGELRIRGSREPTAVPLETGSSVAAVPRKMMKLRGRLELPESGSSISDGIPVRELAFTRTHTEETVRSRSSIVSGRLEFDEEWLNPDRRGDAGEVPGFELGRGDHLLIGAPDLNITDFEPVMVIGRLHFRLVFSGRADVLKTLSGNRLKDSRLTKAEFYALHPVRRMFFKVVYEVSVLMAGLLSLWWMYKESQQAGGGDGPSMAKRVAGRRLRKRLTRRRRR